MAKVCHIDASVVAAVEQERMPIHTMVVAAAVAAALAAVVIYIQQWPMYQRGMAQVQND
jgi:DNA-binding transcriptional regulator of glucitol operon